jgi:RNA polymerase sigma-70 factor (sigma-E family)
VRRADDAEFETFVTGHADALLRLGVLLTGDRQIAEDLVQTALMKVHRRWSRIAADDPYPYARRVLATSAASWFRKRSTQEIVDLPPVDPAGPDRTDEVAERHRVAAALDELPPRMRAVLVLRYAEDLSEAATAAALGLSVHTVNSQTRRGLARLRLLLDDPATVLEEC